MKLAEALIVRADTNRRIEQLRGRLTRSAQVQEGTTPYEDPNALLDELARLLALLTDMVQRINRTNAATPFAAASGVGTLTDALAQRDTLMLERGVLENLVNAASNPQVRVTRSEVKMLSTIDVAGMQKRLDGLSKRLRELDSAIQQANWTVDLLE